MEFMSAAAVCCSSATAPAPAPGTSLAPIAVSLPASHVNHDACVHHAVYHAACASANGTSKAAVLDMHHSSRPTAVSFLPQAPPLTAAGEGTRGHNVVDPTFAPQGWAQQALNDTLFTERLPGFSQRQPHSRLAMEALGVLRANDLGGYTVPTPGLYPYQWNWDSALVAMGWSAVDEARAWEELDQLFSAQWDDGMVPHIVFHRASPTYFPGPEIWGHAGRPMKSTGITQPPIAATAVRRILEGQLLGTHVGNAKSGETAEDWEGGVAVGVGSAGFWAEVGSDQETSSSCSGTGCWASPESQGSKNGEKMDVVSWAKAAEMFPKLMKYHRWFFAARDPQGSGLVATLHPWESGMDNSPAWDTPLANVPVDDIPPYTRRDLGHVDAAMRPHQAEYDRYLTLLYRFRTAEYDPDRLYWLSPFRVSDVCTNSLLHRANLDLRWLAMSLNRLDCVEEIDGWLQKSSSAFDSLWDAEAGIFKSKDQLTGRLLDASTSGGFLPLFARVATPEQAARLAETLKTWIDQVKFGVPSLDPADPKFEGLRYWRGPVWAIVNYMIVDGLRFYGYEELADQIEQDTLTLVQESGLYEYYDPMTGKGAGGSNFSWTAAMVLSWLDKGGSVYNNQQRWEYPLVGSPPQAVMVAMPGFAAAPSPAAIPSQTAALAATLSQ